MKIERREYTLLDFLRIPMSVSPGMTLLRMIDKIIYALLPSLYVLATAGFIDTASAILSGQADQRGIIGPLVFIMLLIAHQYIIFALMGLVKARMKLRLTEAFRTAITDKRARLHYRHVEDNATWDLTQRVGDDPAGKVDGGFDILLRMADMVIRVGAMLLILVAQVWWAALVIMGFSVPLFYLAVKSGKANYEALKEAAKHTRRAGYLSSVLTGREQAEERALFGYSDSLNKRWHERYLAAYHITFRAQRKRFVKMKAGSMITVLISVLIAGVLIAPLGTGAISLGMFMGFVTASFGLAQMMSWEFAHITSELAHNREYLRDLTAFSMLSETPGSTDLPAQEATEPQCIELRDVSFAYPGTDRMILKNLSLKLTAGRHYAFVGVNGAGKTTITKLLTGLYDNYSGDILIDGRNLRGLTQAELKALFSVVYQDFARYQVPMGEAIGLGDVRGMAGEERAPGEASEGLCGKGPETDPEPTTRIATAQTLGPEDAMSKHPQGPETIPEPTARIASAAQTLGLEDAIAKLPQGLSTPLGRIKPDAEDLSGGEWQRVAIARSLVSRAPVHILDEPTAALDPIAESEVYAMFGQVSRGKTTVFITHRLGAARLADEIFVIDQGHVAERGSHVELMDKGGIYAAMYEAQRGWYA